MARRHRRYRTLRWAGTAFSITLLLLYAANVPFYSGSTLGAHWAWRVEHGRLLIRHADQVGHESFYVAPNSEGLRFLPDWRFYSLSDWHVNIPLWFPLGIAVASTIGAWVFFTRRGARGSCPRCGYDLRGLPGGEPCPECGSNGAAHAPPPVS